MADSAMSGKIKSSIQSVITVLAVVTAVISLTYSITTGRVIQKLEDVQRDVTALKISGAQTDVKLEALLDNVGTLTLDLKEHVKK